MARAGISNPIPLATTEEIATFRRKTSGALASERAKGLGPPYKKLNNRIYYDWAEVLAWVEANTRQGTDDQPKTQIAPPLRD